MENVNGFPSCEGFDYLAVLSPLFSFFVFFSVLSVLFFFVSFVFILFIFLFCFDCGGDERMRHLPVIFAFGRAPHNTLCDRIIVMRWVYLAC